MNQTVGVLSRVLLASVFLGLVALRLVIIMNSPTGYEDYQALLGHVGLPGIFAPLLILVQLVGGVALLVGYKTRGAAFLLAILAVFLAAVLGRFQPEVMFLYLGIAGGMLAMANQPVAALGLDGWKK